MKKFNVFITSKIPEAGIELLRKSGFNVEINDSKNKILSKKELIKKIRRKNAVLSLLTDKIDKGVIESTHNKLIEPYFL